MHHFEKKIKIFSQSSPIKMFKNVFPGSAVALDGPAEYYRPIYAYCYGACEMRLLGCRAKQKCERN